jgi:cubilin
VNGFEAHEGSRFKLRWRKIDPSSGLVPLVPFGSECLQELFINSSRTIISSPNYPANYDNDVDCTWILHSDRLSRIQIRIRFLSMEASRRCRYDYLSVYDGTYGQQVWNKTNQICRRSQSRTIMISSGNTVKLKFKTDRSVVRRGFLLEAKSICGGYLSEKQGLISSPDYPNTYGSNLDCKWVLRARPGRTFTFWFDAMNITSADQNICHEDYLMLRNGENTLTAPLILIHPGQTREQQNGRLCGLQLPQRWNSSSNVMSLTFHSDATNSGTGFRMHYMETPFGCGGQVRLSSSEPDFIMNSPNYPNVPSPHAECIWIIMTPPEHRVQVDFLERFDIRPTSGCTLAGLEIRDGGTDFSEKIGTFCKEKPPTQKSSSNVMRVKYYTTSDRPNPGFKARVSIAQCGGTVHVNQRSFVLIQSPNYPASYPTNLECEWTIYAPDGHFITFNFEQIDLPESSNCSLIDNIVMLEPNATSSCKF